MNSELLKRLDILADKLGSTAGQLWNSLLLQSRIEAAEDILVLVACLFSIRLFMAWAKKIMDGKWDEAGWIPLTIAALIVLFLGLCAGYSIPSELFNPEYFALHQILSMLGGK